MSEIEQFMNFLNNNLNDYDEQKFIATLANDADYRLNFKSYMSITNTLNENINYIELPINSRDNFFKSIGITPQGITNNENLKPKTSFFSGKLFTGIVSGIITSIIAYVLVTLMGYHLSNNSNDIAENSKLNNSVEQILPKNSDALNIFSNVPIIESKDTKNQIKKYYPKKNSKMTSKNFNNQVKSKDEDLNNNSPQETKKIDNLNFSQLASNSKFINPIRKIKSYNIEPLQNNMIMSVITPLADEIGNKLRFSLEVKNYINWNSRDEKTFPAQLSKLNNLGLCLFYKITDNFSIGADIRQETFYGVFQGNDSFGIKKNYEQQPNLTSFGIAVKYLPFQFKDFNINNQINFDLNSFGLIARNKIGIEYFLYPDISIIAGFEYSNLWFNHQSNWFQTSKIGISYGINYKF